MTRALLWVWLAAGLALAQPVRGVTWTLSRLQPTGGPAPAAVLFLPGDGGWRGMAVSLGRSIASWGYKVYALDTKAYLESASRGGTLTEQSLAGDVRQAARQVHQETSLPVILVGWSQGAGMAVAAGAAPGDPIVHGVLTVGLPQSAVLGWDWKAALAVLAHREADQPKFPVGPLLRSMTTPLWMIQGTEDEYTAIAACRGMFQDATAPKQLREIAGANHRFDGHREELLRALKEGLEWAVNR